MLDDLTPHADFEQPDRGFYIDVIPIHGDIRQCILGANQAILAGRSPNQCSLILSDVRVSRVHLRIQNTPGQGITVTDLNSANGTLLDGRPLQPGFPMSWLVNQPIVLGSTHLILRYGVAAGKSGGKDPSQRGTSAVG